MSDGRRSRAWIDVDAGALRRNYRTIREAVGPDAALIPMVKADAYGLGVEEAVAALDAEDPWGYGVAAAGEGERLRELGVEGPILVTSPLPPGSEARAVAWGLTPSISDVPALDRLADAARDADAPVDFHVEMDTGMGRAGFDWRDAAEWGIAVAGRGSGRLRWTGCFTHFHSADEAEEPVRRQWKRFRDGLRALPVEEDDLMVHACNSAAALRTPEYAADGARPGIFLYGGFTGQGLPDPEPVAAVRGRVNFVRDASPGSTVGYGATHAAEGWERWATVALGYGDGLPRVLGNRGRALVRGRPVEIIGRISMDVTVVEVGGMDVTAGEVVTFVGRDGDVEIPLREVAGHVGTIDYEILTGLTPRLPRIWSSGRAGEGDG